MLKVEQITFSVFLYFTVKMQSKTEHIRAIYGNVYFNDQTS